MMHSDRFRNQSVHDLRGPWVPAPAKTSSQADILFSRKLPANAADSKSDVKISDIASPATSCSSISDIGFHAPTRSTKNGKQHQAVRAEPSTSNELAAHALQTKDSFVEVTSCLVKKRNRLMKLWEEAIQTNNHELLEHLELANSYGEESAKLLEKLKTFTNELQAGKTKDIDILDTLREKVLHALRNFEDENKTIQRQVQRSQSQIPHFSTGTVETGAGDQSDTPTLAELHRLYSEKFQIGSNPLPFDQPIKPSHSKRLEEKIIEQEELVKGLESELKRVESQHTFDLKLLKSSLDEKLDDLSTFPDVFHLTEIKLAQCMSKLAVMEKQVQDKEAENTKMVHELSMYKSKVDTLTERLRMADCDNSQLKGRLAELETINFSLKKNANADSLLRALESKLDVLKGDNSSAKTDELEEKLRSAKKQAQYYKRAKDENTTRLTRRVNELMEALDESRQKNHVLRNQLRFIRSSYHQLFPSQNIFSASPEFDCGDINNVETQHNVAVSQ